MAKYGIIKAGVVTNIINYDGVGPYVLQTGGTLVSLGSTKAGVGWTYSSGVFTPPTAVVIPPPLPVVKPSSPGRLLKIQRFTSSGTYVPTAGAKTLIIEAVGAGGGGQGVVTGSTTTDFLSSGAGAGGYIKLLLDISSDNVGKGLWTVTLGAGGAGNVGTATAGGQTSLYLKKVDGVTDPITLLTGGQPGIAVALPTTTNFIRQVGGQGGTAAGLQYAYATVLVSRQGEYGGDAVCLNRTLISGNGGSAVFGKGTQGPPNNVPGATIDLFGCGGNGVSRTAGASSAVGAGVGGSALMIIWEYA